MYVIEHVPTGIVIPNPDTAITGPFRFRSYHAAAEWAARVSRDANGRRTAHGLFAVPYSPSRHGPVINALTGRERGYDDPIWR